MLDHTSDALLNQAKRAFRLQQQSLQLAIASLSDSFGSAAAALAHAPSIVTTGLGKSGFVARKMAATLTSLRLRAVYVHPVDALHGDSGHLDRDTCLVAFSKSGETAEVVRFAHHARDLGVRLITVTTRSNSTLAALATATVLAPIEAEFDEQNVLPTASTTTAMFVADLLTVAAAQVAGATPDGLRETHPHGAIGSALLRTVDEVMHHGEALPVVTTQALLPQALAELTAKGLGAVCVVNEQGALAGLLTDGDVRRLVTRGVNVMSAAVQSVMTPNPITILPSATLHEALNIMERRERQISVLPVAVDGQCVGLLRIHDVVRANL